MAGLGFRKAKKEKIWVKVLLAGPSGSGKTYSALRLATGVSRKMGKPVAAIDTENGRIRYYANEFDFDEIQLEQPYSPEKYMEFIDLAVDNGYGVLIIDSISHEWNYCLDLVNKMPGANQFVKWKTVTPRHDAFLEKVLQSPIHVFATVRGKDEYTFEDKGGKQVPKKVGLGYKQREGVEYEYTVTFNIDQQTHVADTTKDNTHIFEGEYDVLTEKHGEKLYDWANSGEEPTQRTTVKMVEEDLPVDEVKERHDKITELCNQKGGKANKPLITLLKTYDKMGNYIKIKDLTVLNELYERIDKEIEVVE